jgi:hypothetical protein
MPFGLRLVVTPVGEDANLLPRPLLFPDEYIQSVKYRPKMGTVRVVARGSADFLMKPAIVHHEVEVARRYLASRAVGEARTRNGSSGNQPDVRKERRYHLPFPEDGVYSFAPCRFSVAINACFQKGEFLRAGLHRLKASIRNGDEKAITIPVPVGAVNDDVCHRSAIGVRYVTGGEILYERSDDHLAAHALQKFLAVHKIFSLSSHIFSSRLGKAVGYDLKN